MSTFNIDGLISGLNTTDIIRRLGELDRAPITRLRARQSATNAGLTALKDLQTRLAALRDKSLAVGGPSAFQAVKASSSETDVLTVSTSSTAPQGAYVIAVDALASAHQIATASEFADPDAAVFGTGTIDISVGAEVTTVTIGGANNSLAGIADAINASGADARATLVQGAAGWRLVLTAKRAGASSPVSLTSSLAGGASSIGAFDEWQAASDAQIRVGTGASALVATRPSNVVSDVLPGVTLSLVGTSVTPVTVRIDADPAAARAAVTDFVAAYNDVVTLIREKTAYDPATRVAGALQGNSTVARIQQRMHEVVTQVLPESAGSIRQIVDAGVTVGRDGKLTIDNTKLDAALAADPAAVRALFATTGSASDPDIAFLSAGPAAVAPGAGGYAVAISAAADAGVDVAGTINGEAATGRGQVLTGAEGNPTTAGIAVRVGLTPAMLASQGAAQGVVTFTHGIGARLASLVAALDAEDTGQLTTAIEAAKDRIEEFDRQIQRTEARAAAREAAYRRQFSALESQLATLQRQSQWLNQQIANLSRSGGSS